MDGVKYIMADDSWLLIRPSGTEPVLRVYAEGRTPGDGQGPAGVRRNGRRQRGVSFLPFFNYWTLANLNINNEKQRCLGRQSKARKIH